MNFGSVSRHTIKERIVKDNLIPYECAECHTDQWRGKKLTLHLDHINGINNDNRLDNLRFLCPNCHSQTDTYCGKNNGVKFTSKNHKVSDDILLNHMRTEKDPMNALKTAGLAGAGNFQRIYRLAELHDIEHMKHKSKQLSITHFKECSGCSKSFETKNFARLFCSRSCAAQQYQANRNDLITISVSDIVATLEKNKYNYLKTSRELGISDTGMRRKLKVAGIDRIGRSRK